VKYSRKLQWLLTLISFTFSTIVIAIEQKSIDLGPNELKVKVSGVVCSFCAYGVERNISKLNFMDKSKFGDDGVLIDISTQFITIATDASKKVHYGDICKAIVKGGYEPKEFYMRVTGKLDKKGKSIILSDQNSSQKFNISGEIAKSLIDSKNVTLNLFVDTENMDDLKEVKLVNARVFE